MRYSMRKQKDKPDFHGVKVGSSSLHWCIPAGQVPDLSALILLKTKVIQAFLGVIFILVTTLCLVVLGDKVSVVQIGLHLPLWPRTLNNLRSTREFTYTYVHPEEMGMRTLLRDTLRSFQSTQVEHRFTIPKPSSNKKRHDHNLEVPNQESSDHQRAVRATATSPDLENATPTVIAAGDLLRRRDDPSSNASTSVRVESHHDRAREVRWNTDRWNGWIQFPYIALNETEQLMLQIRQNGTIPCHDIRTRSAQLLGLPQPSELDGEEGRPVFLLSAGPVHELTIVSVGDDGRPRCAGGDYYETDLSGPLWKSRPPVLDCNNGTYSVRLQMDPRLASGVYTFTIILLFSNFHALHYHPRKWARMEEVARHRIKFVVGPGSARISDRPPTAFRASSNSSTDHGSEPSLAIAAAAAPDPELPLCRLEDFSKKYWSGRWTRERETKDCEYDRHGRWKCVELDLQCQKPWCRGPVGRLESNGWVYSAHCAFRIFEKEEAWRCLDGRWLFFWGDSNHIDTIRNLLNFVLGFEHKVRFIDRRMDATYFSSPNNRSSVRITSMFNGHSNVTMNYQGLFSLRDPEYAQQLRSFFMGEVAPDVMIMNSGLHDGVFWRDVNRYVKDGVEFAANFWASVWSEMKARRPDLLYRTTVSTGGSARNMSFNPHKMELFNHLVVDRFLKMELERFHIVDGFDYTYPWHYDHKTNDGVHYGRPPAKSKWAGGNMGHRYFVDLMLVHMLLNAICAPSSHIDH